VFSGLQPPGSWKRDYRAVAPCVAAHLVLLGLIVFSVPKAIDLKPVWLAYGDSSHSYRITYVPSGPEEIHADARLRLPAEAKPSPRPKPQTLKAKPADPRPLLDAKADEGDRNTRAGTPLGTVLDGPITGHEVRIAFPVYPEPQVDRAGLPHDLSGDVVIEVTIDSEGNVVETRIIQAIGRGIDEQLVAVIRRRHYQPATLDGTPVASRQDVHFHFPS